MTRTLRYLYTADGDLVSELDVEIPDTPTRVDDPRRARRWQARPVRDPEPDPPRKDPEQ